MNCRRLLINSVYNMRELGGFETKDGNFTQYGRFIRSSCPENLSGSDIDFIKNYGLKTVIDLRWESEAQETVHAFSNVEGIDYYNIPFTDSFRCLNALDFNPKLHYIPILEDDNRVDTILGTIANAKEGAVMFNCAVGKDRTGIIAALLLLIANVPEVDIIADYQVSYTYLKELLNTKYATSLRNEELRKTPPEYIIPLLDFIKEKGGVYTYLQSKGVSLDVLNKIKGRFINEI